MDCVTQTAPGTSLVLPTDVGEVAAGQDDRTVDFDRLRETVVAGVARAVVVEHGEGRDGMGEVGTIASLAEILDRLPGCDDAEILTESRVIRVVRTASVAVAVAFPLVGAGVEALDEVLPVRLAACTHRFGPEAAALAEAGA